MKNKVILSLFALTLFIAKVNAQDIIPDKTVNEQTKVQKKIIKVKAVQVLLDSSVGQSNSSTSQYYFKAIVSSIGTGAVSYQWVRSNPINPAAHHLIPGTLTLSGKGTDVIFIKQGAAAGGPNSILLQVLSPNVITSNKQVY